jgi:hypothetical protein
MLLVPSIPTFLAGDSQPFFAAVLSANLRGQEQTQPYETGLEHQGHLPSGFAFSRSKAATIWRMSFSS